MLGIKANKIILANILLREILSKFDNLFQSDNFDISFKLFI